MEKTKGRYFDRLISKQPNKGMVRCFLGWTRRTYSTFSVHMKYHEGLFMIKPLWLLLQVLLVDYPRPWNCWKGILPWRQLQLRSSQWHYLSHITCYSILWAAIGSLFPGHHLWVGMILSTTTEKRIFQSCLNCSNAELCSRGHCFAELWESKSNVNWRKKNW